jgi:H+/gluconate symporter-like permease
MGAAARFLGQFFPLFLMGALFGKLMDDTGSVRAIADYATSRLGKRHAVLAVVLAGALVTYGGVSVFVAFFVLAPMAKALFRTASIPRRLVPAAIVLGTSTFTMTAMPGTPAIQNAIPMPFFKTTPFAAPGLGVIASAVMLGVGMWWLGRAQSRARRSGEGYDRKAAAVPEVAEELLRERATTAREFDPAEVPRGARGDAPPPIVVAALPLVVVVGVNLVMSLVVLPRRDFSFLEQERWGGVQYSAVAGVWSVLIALGAAIATLVVLNRRRLPRLRDSMDAGVNASVLPALTVASLVGFGSVVAAAPSFTAAGRWLLTLPGAPPVSLAISANVLAALTGSATGGLTIALDTLGGAYMRIAAEHGINPELMHRVATIGAGTLDLLPHNGAVVTLLAVCGATHRESYFDIVMVGIVTALLALIAVIVLGLVFGSF